MSGGDGGVDRGVPRACRDCERHCSIPRSRARGRVRGGRNDRSDRASRAVSRCGRALASLEAADIRRGCEAIGAARRRGVVPTALFYCSLVLVGVGAAYGAALLWRYVTVGNRLVRRRPVAPLLVLGTVDITVPTAVSVSRAARPSGVASRRTRHGCVG